jgi:hypothetical protein
MVNGEKTNTYVLCRCENDRELEQTMCERGERTSERARTRSDKDKRGIQTTRRVKRRVVAGRRSPGEEELRAKSESSAEGHGTEVGETRRVRTKTCIKVSRRGRG